MSNIIKNEKINWTGENPYIRLYDGEGGAAVTSVSFFRIVYSAQYGRGHVLFLLSDVRADGFSREDDYCVCLTDNLELANWLRNNIVKSYTGFKDMPKEYSAMEVIETKDFQSSGDPRYSWTETVKGEGLEIVLTWKSLDEPFYCEIPPTTWPYLLYTVLQPARSAEAHINGNKLVGQVREEQFHGMSSTSCCLAFSETWLEME